MPKRAEGPRCVLTMPLLTEPWQEHILETRFRIILHLKNQLVRMEWRKYKDLCRTKEFRQLEEQIEATPKEERRPLHKKRRELLKAAGLSEYRFKADISDMQKQFSRHIAVKIAENAASDVWRAFDTYLFKKGQEVHTHSLSMMRSVAGQAGNGMHYIKVTKKGKDYYFFKWNVEKEKEEPTDQKKRPSKKQTRRERIRGKKSIPLKISITPPRNAYEREMLEKPVKYLRVVRRWIKSRYKYYLQFTLEGHPVPKPKERGTGRVGIDIGTRTIAVVSGNEVHLEELVEVTDRDHRRSVDQCQRRKAALRRKMDRSSRIMNPQNFKPDGSVKPRKELTPWKRSNRYKRLAGKVRELERKNADVRKYEHSRLADRILAMGDEIFLESMNFSALQRRKKKTEKDKKGRYAKKKRFGKSIAHRAPATLVSTLERKAAQRHQTVVRVKTETFRASQLDHTTGEYRKTHLSERRKTLSNGDEVQRDLYAAFLLMNSASTWDEKKKEEVWDHSDLDACRESYGTFKVLHDAEILRIANDGRQHPSSFGIA